MAIAAPAVPAAENPVAGMTPELQAYYADRRLMIRNIVLIGLSNLGWSVAQTIIVPLITLRLLELGVRENIQGTIGAVNGYLVSFLVMLFSWMSDNTAARMGRRKPYLFISAPFIIIPMLIFPFMDEPQFVWLLITLQIVKMLFMDMKASTFPLLSIDCVPRHLLAQANSVFTIIGGIVGFVAMRYAGKLTEVSHSFPFVLGGSIMICTTAIAWWIKEPPIPNIKHFRFKDFRPWSTFSVAALDKRIFILMAGVGMVAGFFNMSGTWLWFWAKETLNLNKKDIFDALSWAGLVNIGLAYPVAWLIDRWGSLKVVTVYVIGQLCCFAYAMQVHDKSGLIALSLASTIIGPLYAAADIAVYKSSDPKDIGSITSTNSCLRNAWNATLGGVSGWVIYWCGHNYRIGFMMGAVATVIGYVFFASYTYIMRRKSAPSSPVAEATPAA